MTRKWTEAELAAIVKRSGARLIDRDLKAEPLKLRESLPVARTDKPTKYKAVRTEVDGIVFASKKEAGRYVALRLMAKAGSIADLKLQPRIKLSADGIHICDYVADFFYTTCVPEPVRVVYEDCKGFKTPVYRLKKKLVKALCNIDITEI